MNKIDIHTHILPPDIPFFKKQFGYGGFIQLEHVDSCCNAWCAMTVNFFATLKETVGIR